jgi:hypothetical protein
LEFFLGLKIFSEEDKQKRKDVNMPGQSKTPVELFPEKIDKLLVALHKVRIFSPLFSLMIC